jgi:O-antigen ligase
MTSQPLIPSELLSTTRNRWDQVVEVLLALLLVFMPLAFGAVDAWSELVVMALAAALTLVVLARAIFDRTFQLPWTWAYAPLAIFVLLIIFQMTPLPMAWVAILSPAAAETRTTFLGEPGAMTSNATISLYPLATAHGLRLVLVGAAVFFVTFTVFRTAPQIRRLLLCIFAVGCVEATLAVMQIVTDADRLYWAIDAGTNRLTSGSFINYSNFSQFINLSIGAGVALLLVKLLDHGSSSQHRDSASRPFGGTRLGDHGALLAGLVLLAVAVFASLSRNGAFSLLVAGLLVGAALCARGKLNRRGWVLALLPIATVAILLFFGFDGVYDRFAILENRNQFDGRWALTLGALHAWREFPVWGAGLGTHEFVFPMFDTSMVAALAGHADNDYVQLLEEMGVAGAACVIAFLAIVVTAVVRLCWRGQSALSGAAFGLALGLIAVAIHSVTDFGQHVPAVFCLSAITCALALRLLRLEGCSRRPLRSLGQQGIAWRRAAAGVAAAAIAFGWAWVLRDAYAAHVGEQWWAAALQLEEEIHQAGPIASDEEFADLLAATQQAVASQPHNVIYLYWLNAFRWQSLSSAADPGEGQAALAAMARPLVARIADELAGARRICPTFGPAYGLEGQLRLYVLGDAAGAELIAKGVRLAPYDSPTCLTAGELAAREGNHEKAMSLLRRAVALAPSCFADVATIALDVLDRPAFACELAGDDHARLQQLADLADARENRAALGVQLRRDAEMALRRRAETDAATASELAALAAIDASRSKHSAAAELYRRALLLDYDQVDWRLARARALMAGHENVQAMRELRTCLSLRPNHALARQLAEELSLRVE